MVPIIIGTHRTTALLDSGAGLSVCPSRIHRLLGPPFASLEPAATSFATLAGPVSILGFLQVPINLGPVTVVGRLAVVQDQFCSYSAILGVDFIKQLGPITIDIPNNQVLIRNVPVSLRCVDSLLSSPVFTPHELPGPLRLVQDITIPPRQVKLVRCRLPDAPEATYLTEAVHSLWNQYQVRMPPVALRISSDDPLVPLASGGQGRFVMLPLLNFDNCPRRLYQHQTIANMEPVDILQRTGTQIPTNVVNALDTIPPLTIEDIRKAVTLEETDLTPDQKEEIWQLLYDHRGALARHDMDLGHCTIAKMHIDVGDAAPIAKRPYRVADVWKDKVKDILDQMQDRGIIEPSSSEWASPLLVVAKRNGDPRLVVDYRNTVNRVIKSDQHPLPKIDELLHTIKGKGAAYISTFDMCNGFFQVELDEASRDYTAFTSYWGLYRFCRVPQGIKSGPAVFERAVEHALSGMLYDFALSYLDDVICFSASFDEHKVHLAKFLQRLIDVNLRIKLSKAQLCRRKIKFLGYEVSPDGIATDDLKIKAIKDLKSPTNIKETSVRAGPHGLLPKIHPNVQPTRQVPLRPRS